MMSKKFILILGCVIASVANAESTVPLPATVTVAGTASGVPIGKVTYISRDQLPPGMKERTDNDIQNSTFGQEAVSDDVIARRENYQSRLRPLSAVMSNLRIKLSPINSTELANFQFEGIIPDGPTLQGPWTSVIRVFKRPDGAPIFLTEWDYVADGGSVVAVKELMNTKIGAIPGRFVVKKSPNGKALSELIWATEKKRYKLALLTEPKGAVFDSVQEQKFIIKIAENLTDQ